MNEQLFEKMRKYFRLKALLYRERDMLQSVLRHPAPEHRAAYETLLRHVALEPAVRPARGVII